MQIRANENNNQIIHVSSAARERAQERAGGNGQEQKNRKTIFMGDLNIQKDPITQRKQYARQKALKMIGEAWDGDRRTDRSISDTREKLSLLHDEFAENRSVIAEGEAQKEALRQEYGIAADSQEQKDLELLEKKADFMRKPGEVVLTEEEEARLKELKEIPLTEYQKRSMEIDNYQQFYEKRNDVIEDQIEAYNGSIRAIKLERLKFHEMVDAQKKADGVMEAASKEVIGMLMEEAKDHVDEEMEEKKEEAEKKAEEKAEQEEKIEEREEEQMEVEIRIDEAREKSEEREELRREAEERSREDAVLLGDMIDAGMVGAGSLSNVQTDVKNMLHKMRLLEEDLKGSIVDEES